MDPLPARLPLLDDARPAVRLPARAAFALAAAAGGLGAVALLEPWLGRPYYLPAFAAVVLSAVIAGARYGMATALSFAAGYAYAFLAPRGSLAVKNEREVAALIAYSLTAMFVAAIAGALRTAYAQLRAQHAAMERVHAQREDLLRAMTHDIRSPLSVIALNAELLARGVDADPATLRRARLVRASAAAIEAMVRDLVEVVALESGQLRLAPADVDVGTMVQAVREGLAETPALERVRVALPPGLPQVRADRQRVERVLWNLVSNALKYSPGAVTVGARAHDRRVVLSVRDEGPGIAREDLPRIFDKYYRAAAARSQDGLGLGLYISRLVVEAHGGRIWAESEAGKGSTFHVALPASEGASFPEPQPDRAA
jgi:signal transduction histidine kinase